MDQAAVKAEYERLGYKLGWAFATCPIEWLGTKKIVLVGLNPDGDDKEEWDCKKGDAYLKDRYFDDPAALDGVHEQVKKLHELLELGDEDVFSAFFIPFRSPSIEELAHYDEALKFATQLWSSVLSQSPASLFICMGKVVAEGITKLLGASIEANYPSGFGEHSVSRFVSPDGKVVVRLPHPGRFPLLSLDGEKLKTAKQAILQACRPPPPAPGRT